MKTKRKNALKIALGLGAVAGMRSIMAPAMLSHYLNYSPRKRVSNSKLSFFQSPIFSKTVKLMAAGELIGDKTPGIPPRINKGALAGRAISGAMVGAAAFKYKKQKVWYGAILGAASAIASAYATFYLRQSISQKSEIPDTVIAVAEDLIAIGSGAAIMETSS